MLNLGKIGGGCGVITVLVSVDNWWYSCHLFLFLMSLLVGDVVDLEEVSVRKPDKILPHTWVYQKVPRLSSTDRKQMALGEYLRYD